MYRTILRNDNWYIKCACATQQIFCQDIFGRKPEFDALIAERFLCAHSLILTRNRVTFFFLRENFKARFPCVCSFKAGALSRLHSIGFSLNALLAIRNQKIRERARARLWICEATPPRYRGISSPSPAGAMKIFLWIRYKRIFSFMARDISLKRKSFSFLLPPVFHFERGGRRRRRRANVSILVLSRAKKKPSTEIRYAKVERVAIRLVIWYASLRGILQIARARREVHKSD